MYFSLIYSRPIRLLKSSRSWLGSRTKIDPFLNGSEWKLVTASGKFKYLSFKYIYIYIYLYYKIHPRNYAWRSIFDIQRQGTDRPLKTLAWSSDINNTDNNIFCKGYCIDVFIWLTQREFKAIRWKVSVDTCMTQVFLRTWFIEWKCFYSSVLLGYRYPGEQLLMSFSLFFFQVQCQASSLAPNKVEVVRSSGVLIGFPWKCISMFTTSQCIEGE